MATYTIYGRMVDGASSNGQYSTNGTTWTNGPYVQNLNITNQDTILLYMRPNSSSFPRQSSPSQTIDSVDFNYVIAWGNDYNDDGDETFGGVPSTHVIRSRSNRTGSWSFELNDQEKVGSNAQTAQYYTSNFRMQGTAFRDAVLAFGLGADFVNQTPGAACTRTVSPTGYVTPQLVVATGSAITSINGTTFNASNKTVAVGGTVYVRVIASSSFSTPLTGGVTIGNGGNTESDSFNVTTVSQNTNVNDFGYTNVTGSALNTTHIQSTQITGFTGTLGVTQTGSVTFGIANSGAISGSNPVTYGSTGNITPGQYLFVNLTSNNTYGATVSGTVYVGPQSNDESATWSVTNEGQDITPNPAVVFADTTGVTPSTTHVQYAQVTGIDAPSSSQPVALTISGCEWALSYYIAYQWQTPNYNSPSSIILDAPVRLYIRQTASASFSTQSTASIKVGAGNADTATVTTRAPYLTPNSFSFGANATGQARSTNFDRTVTISGFETTIPVNISGITGSASFKVNNGSFSTSPKTISTGDTVTLRVTSSNSFSTFSEATITAGTGSSARSSGFRVTTLAADTTPSSLSFPTITGALASSPRIQTDQILDINTGASVSGSGNGVLTAVTPSLAIPASSSFTAATKTVTNGQYVHAKMNASATAGATVSSTITVGTLSATYSIVTATTSSGGGGTGTGAGSSATTDYGLQITGADGTTEVLGVSNRTSNLIVSIPTLSVAANSTSSVISCPAANDSSKVLIVVSSIGGGGVYQSNLSITNKSSTGFTVSNSYGYALSCTVYAIRIT